jgi:hypothetical protein
MYFGVQKSASIGSPAFSRTAVGNGWARVSGLQSRDRPKFPRSGNERGQLPAVAVDFSPKWEFNFGVGLGVTQATDRWIIKAILGCRFNLKQN